MNPPRPAGPDEAEALAAIHASAFAPGERWGAAAIAALLALPGTAALLAGGSAAMVMVRLAADEGEILTLAVRPERRRRGLARDLLAAAAALAASGGARTLHLEVGSGNAAAIALYRAAGFGPVGRRRAYYPDGSDALLMARPLACGSAPP